MSKFDPCRSDGSGCETGDQCCNGYCSPNPQGMPESVVVPAILTELSNPNVKTRQIGNTLFEIIPGKNSTAFFKAFNADTGQNFVENSKQFVVWAKHVLGLQTLVTQFTDPSIETLFKVIEANPAAQALLGEGTQPLTGRPFPEGFDPRSARTIRALLAPPNTGSIIPPPPLQH